MTVAGGARTTAACADETVGPNDGEVPVADTPGRARRRWAALAVVAVALVVRVAYWRYATGDYRPASDAWHYYEIARNLADGRGFSHQFPQFDVHPTAFRTPVFPGVLGALFWLFGPSVALGRLLNLVVSLASVALGMRLADRLGLDERGRIATGLGLALFPPLVFNDVVLLTEPISILLLLTSGVLLAEGRTTPAGFTTGLLVLSRTSAQFVFPVFVVWVLWRWGWRRALRFGVLVLIVVVPWAVRNAVQVGSFTLATSNGFNLAAMYGPAAQARGGFVDPVTHPGYDHLRFSQFDEAEWSGRMAGIGVDAIRADPTLVAEVARRNLPALLELRPAANVSAERLDGRNLDVRSASVWVVPFFAVAGTLGLWRLRRSPVAVLLALVAAYFVAVSVVTIAVPRLRAPVDVVWCLGVGALVSGTVRPYQASQWITSAAGARLARLKSVPTVWAIGNSPAWVMSS